MVRRKSQNVTSFYQPPKPIRPLYQLEPVSNHLKEEKKKQKAFVQKTYYQETTMYEGDKSRAAVADARSGGWCLEFKASLVETSEGTL